MSTDINGYNSSFQNFVDFAQRRVDVADESSIARVTSTTVTLDGDQTHTIKASSTDKLGFFAAIFRSSADRADNDAARAAFRQAVADMFGGESKIPPSVKDAMKLGDFGHGRPLTARRILAVRNAIDATGILRNAALARDPGFANPATAARATQMGYTRAELPTVARAIRYYQLAMNCSEAVAANEVFTPGSKANRLLQYGGRFLASPENFRNGLRLMDSFAAWYGGLRQMRGLSGAALAARADTPSKLHVQARAIERDATLGFERTVFEDIAHDPDFNLRETDPEQAFGFENNATSRFLGRCFGQSALGTVNALPPSKRRVLYAVFDTLAPLGPVASRLVLSGLPTQISRVVKNLNQLAILHDRGQLTAEKVVEICYPDMPAGGRCDIKSIDEFISLKTMYDLSDKFNVNVATTLTANMEATGATAQEVVAAYREGRTLFPLPFYFSGSPQLADNDGSPASGRALLRIDLERVQPFQDGNGHVLLPPEDNAWDFHFPDGQRIKVDGETRKGNANTVMDKVEALCRQAHPRQINTVMLALSQASLAQLQANPLKPYGIHSTEHTPIKITLSRNNDTGAITIRYSNPDALPVKFSWETTIAVDGSSTSTPMTIIPPAGH